MSPPAPKSDENPIASAIHLEYIRTLADSNGGAGLEEVEAFHRAIFLNHHGKDLERFQQERRTREERLAMLDARLGHVRQKLLQEEPLVPVMEDGRPDTEPTSPWNLWDRSMFVVAAAAIVCLLVFGVLNVSFNLLESGIVTFAEQPMRAYLWAALLPVGALAVKVGWDFLESRRKRDAYLWGCLGTGLAAVVVWVITYASIYPALSKTVDDHLESLRVSQPSAEAGNALAALTTGGVKWIDMLLVSSQAAAEICLSAALGIFLTTLYARHRPVRLARNPTFAQLDAERGLLETEVAAERLALAEAKGDEARLSHQLTVFVAYAKSLFQKEAALRADRGHQKRILLGEIAEQLRSRLEALDQEGDAPGQDHDPQPDRGHGPGRGARRLDGDGRMLALDKEGAR